ncbi:MAG: Gfo/Idh/MocA family oxidoreductase, partial [Rhodospirillales bacterium]|nr:Gfo/Idh/MocA family oxidoreductase [Rhodospirillales bacterium]
MGAAATLGGISSRAYAAGSDEIRVGLIGCGGRGTGAAGNAMNAADGVKLIAMGDLFEDRLKSSYDGLKKNHGEKVIATTGDLFVGFDAYKKVIHHPDVNYVILTTPPGFRPIHFEEAINAGKHVFFEKPVAVDPVGCRSIIKTGELAKKKGLGVVTGTIYRRAPHFIAAHEKLHDGSVGEMTAGYGYFMTGGLWRKDKAPGMSAMEHQCRNWLYYTWLSGDH